MKTLARFRLFVALFLLALPVLLLLMAFSLQTAPPEWVEYLAFAILVPLVIQGLRLLAAKGVHLKVRGTVARVASLVIALLVVYLSGGFGLIAVPIYAGDVVAFIGPLLAFIVAVWAPVELMYRLIVKSIEGTSPALSV